MIMRGPASRRLSWFGLAGAIGLGLLALPAWTLGGDKPPSPQPTAPAASPTVSEAQSTRKVAPENAPAAAPQPVPAAVVERNQKLKELEDKVQKLLQEIQQLQGQGPILPPDDAFPVALQEAIFGLGYQKPSLVAPGATPTPAVPAESGAEVTTLTRATYKLKPTTAEALASFLKENVKTAILETKSEGESLVITTTPEAQKAIGQFIHLLQGPTGVQPPAKAIQPRYGDFDSDGRPDK